MGLFQKPAIKNCERLTQMKAFKALILTQHVVAQREKYLNISVGGWISKLTLRIAVP